jgi:hypothetical protein
MIENDGRLDIFECLAANGYFAISCPELPTFAVIMSLYGLVRHLGRLPVLPDDKLNGYVTSKMFLELLNLGLPLNQPLGFETLTRYDVLDSSDMALPRKLLEWGVDPDDRSHIKFTMYPGMVFEGPETALEWSLRRLNPVLAKLLLSFGAQISEVRRGAWRKQAWAIVMPTLLTVRCGMVQAQGVPPSAFSALPPDILRVVLDLMLRSYYKRQ